MELLDLTVLDYEGPTRWRWRLTEPDGRYIVDHQVALDRRSWEYEAFSDLDRYLHLLAAPDRMLTSGADLVDKVGRWVGEEVFGPVAPSLSGGDVLRTLADLGTAVPAEQPFLESMLKAVEALEAAPPGDALDARAAALIGASEGEAPDRGNMAIMAILLRRFVAGEAGVTLDQLTEGLDSTDETVASIIESVGTVVSGKLEGVGKQLRLLIDKTVAAARLGPASAPSFEAFLTQLADNPDWGALAPDWVALAPALRRIIVGERSPTLVDGLDKIDTLVVTTILDELR